MSLSALAAEVIRLLSDAWADKDIAIQGGATPLFIASQSGHLEVVLSLVSDAEADRVIAMQGGGTPLFIAPQQGRQEVVCLLSEAVKQGTTGTSQCRVAPPPCSSHLRVDTSRWSVCSLTVSFRTFMFDFAAWALAI